MNYLHYTVKAGPKNIIEITLNERAIVRVLDTLNYYKYSQGKSYNAIFEYRNTPSLRVKVPHKSKWHVIVEHGIFDGVIKAIVDVV